MFGQIEIDGASPYLATRSPYLGCANPGAPKKKIAVVQILAGFEATAHALHVSSLSFIEPRWLFVVLPPAQ